jgi:hypothetical protein
LKKLFRDELEGLVFELLRDERRGYGLGHVKFLVKDTIPLCLFIDQLRFENRARVGGKIRALIPSAEVVFERGYRSLKFPPFAQSRREFEAAVGAPVDWARPRWKEAFVVDTKDLPYVLT